MAEGSADRGGAPYPTRAAGDSFLFACYREGLRLLFKLYFRAVHRITIEGMENVPASYEKLIVIANHASLIDGLLIWTYLKLPFKIIVDRNTAKRLLYRPFMQNRYTVQIDSMSPYALKEVIRRVNEGTPLLIFPEGRMTLTGSLMKIYEGTGFAALRTGAEILPLYLGTYKTRLRESRLPAGGSSPPSRSPSGRPKAPISLPDPLPAGPETGGGEDDLPMLAEVSAWRP